MFYVFEGVDGSGKSTQARRLKEHLERAAIVPVVEVREPGGTALGESVREILLDPHSGDLSAEVEVFLFMAARAHLCRTTIAPALDEGRIIVADRFLWSSVVYQGTAGGMKEGDVLELGRIATHSLEPSCIFVIDIDPEVALGRLSSHDRMERRGVEFQRRVRQGYVSLVEQFPERSYLVDGGGSPDEVHRRVLGALAARTRKG